MNNLSTIFVHMSAHFITHGSKARASYCHLSARSCFSSVHTRQIATTVYRNYPIFIGFLSDISFKFRNIKE